MADAPMLPESSLSAEDAGNPPVDDEEAARDVAAPLPAPGDLTAEPAEDVSVTPPEEPLPPEGFSEENAVPVPVGEAPPRRLRRQCIFFARGYCRNGPACSFEHCPPFSLAFVPDPKRPGDCSCSSCAPNGTTGKTDECRKSGRVLRKNAGGASADGRASSCSGGGARKDAGAELKANEGTPRKKRMREALECGVCFESPAVRKDRYGLLTGCDHVFCLSCLVKWRRGGTSESSRSAHLIRRTCPLCRAASNFIVPSFEVYRGAEKERVVEQFRARCAEIPCKYFDGRTGCPFAYECFYKHVLPSGEVVDKESQRKEVVGAASSARRRARVTQRNRYAMEEEHRRILAQVLDDVLDLYGAPQIPEAEEAVATSRVDALRVLRETGDLGSAIGSIHATLRSHREAFDLPR